MLHYDNFGNTYTFLIVSSTSHCVEDPAVNVPTTPGDSSNTLPSTITRPLPDKITKTSSHSISNETPTECSQIPVDNLSVSPNSTDPVVTFPEIFFSEESSSCSISTILPWYTAHCDDMRAVIEGRRSEVRRLNENSSCLILFSQFLGYLGVQLPKSDYFSHSTGRSQRGEENDEDNC